MRLLQAKRHESLKAGESNVRQRGAVLPSRASDDTRSAGVNGTALNKNYIDMDEYPITTERQAIMLAGLALKRTQQNERKAGLLPWDKANIVTGANIQVLVCTQHFSSSEARIASCPNILDRLFCQLLSERLIPHVALDVRSERVSMGRALDLPVFFGDAGNREVRFATFTIALDTPGANYRTVWALSKYYPHVKTFVRAHDVDHGMSLEKAGATAVVPETLEPSLQLAAAILAQAKLPPSEIAAAIDEFRSNHLSELTELSEASGSSLGYGITRTKTKPKLISPELLAKDDDGTHSPSQGVLAVP